MGRVLLVLCAFTGICAPAAPAATGTAASTGSRAASLTPAPIGVFPGGVAARSVANFELSLGRRVDFAHEFIHKSSWSSMTDVRYLKRMVDDGFAGRTVLTVPMLPDRGGTLQQGANGKFNRYFRLLAQRLVAIGEGSAVLRVGHEFNGTWFRWTIDGAGNSSRYKTYWRQIVTTMRGVSGANFRFDWAPNGGSSWVNGGRRRLRAETAYPGNEYVDFIGLDVFDQSWAPHSRSPSARWQEFMTQTDGLNWQARFAEAHGKPMTFPEWGLVKRRDGRGGGDNPYFVMKMHEWIQTHPVAYHLYFESRDPNGDYRVFSGRFPKAAASFVQYFGAQSPAALVPAP